MYKMLSQVRDRPETMIIFPTGPLSILYIWQSDPPVLCSPNLMHSSPNIFCFYTLHLQKMFGDECMRLGLQSTGGSDCHMYKMLSQVRDRPTSFASTHYTFVWPKWWVLLALQGLLRPYLASLSMFGDECMRLGLQSTGGSDCHMYKMLSQVRDRPETMV
jgi:hypothetical protein